MGFNVSRIKRLLRIIEQAMVLVAVLFANVQFFFYGRSIQLLYLIALVINFLLIIHARKQKHLFIMFCFFFSYLSQIGKCFFSDIQISYHESFTDTLSLGKTLQVHGIFLYFIFLFYKPAKSDVSICEKIPAINNTFIYLINLLPLTGLLLFGKSGDSIFSSGGYGQGKVSSMGGLFEYFSVFFLIGVIYSGTSKWKRLLLYILALVYCLKSVLMGGRIEAVQLILLVFILFFEKRFRIIYILIALVSVSYLSDVYGRIRSNPLLFLKGDLTEAFNIFNNEEITTLSSQQGDVFQASSRLIGFTDNGVLEWDKRLVSFVNYILAVFTPTSLLQEYANLSAFKQTEFSSGGGGLISAYFFVWLSWPGVIGIAFFIVKVINSTYNRNNSNYWTIYGIMVLATFPRWFAYTPIVMFKMCIYSIIIYFCYKKLTLFIKK